MKPLHLMNFAEGRWTLPSGDLAEARSAITGEVVALMGSEGLDFPAMVAFGRRVGGPALRSMTFHGRARMLKAAADALMARKEELYEVSLHSGATRSDAWVGIEGGAGALSGVASKG